VEEKGVDILLDAIERTHLDTGWKERILWTICSDGLYERDVRDLVEKYPDAVFYKGKMSPVKLASLYRESDFLFMPSRFLETFWLTALESLACGTPVIGFQKGGLTSFIPDHLTLDPTRPVESLFEILERDIPDAMTVDTYASQKWKEGLREIFTHDTNIALLHDYREKIGGAEYYVDMVEGMLSSLEKNIARYSYEGRTSPWKRRLLFIFSLFTFWRYFEVWFFLRRAQPDAIWMHSIMRYIGLWWILAVRHYMSAHTDTKIFLSHHDIWLLAPFPQMVREESQIPESFALRDFLSDLDWLKKIIAWAKWIYVLLYKKAFPTKLTHIIFSPFMEWHIKNHFPNDEVILLLHAYDEKVFSP
jgi:glycosyltransferase involved in cell wall biosynthesis